MNETRTATSDSVSCSTRKLNIRTKQNVFVEYTHLKRLNIQQSNYIVIWRTKRKSKKPNERTNERSTHCWCFFFVEFLSNSEELRRRISCGFCLSFCRNANSGSLHNNFPCVANAFARTLLTKSKLIKVSFSVGLLLASLQATCIQREINYELSAVLLSQSR